MKKTKIVCTMGPNTNDREMMRKLIQNGMNVARFNFSHGDHEEQKFRMDMLKELREEEHANTAILLDTKGPEIRTGILKDGKKITLKEGETFTLTTEDIVGDNKRVSITYKGLVQDIYKGCTILIDDGLIGLRVESKTETEIVCSVVNGGELGERKGVNVPNVAIRLPAITEKDKDDIRFGVEQDIDFIAASFVRNAECILEIRSYLNKCGAPYIPIIAKIENQQGVDNIDEIIEAADGIMIARGDMGVEIPPEYVPVIQQKIIQKVYTAGKPVITATQMLDSMISHPRPTRAEATDVANAIFQGTSATMLSGETAAGKYPVQALQMMSRIAEHMEQNIDYNTIFKKTDRNENPDITNAIAHATCLTAIDLKASAILSVTKSGSTAHMMSKHRPGCLIGACTSSERVLRQLNLSWGVYPMLIKEEYSSEILCLRAIEAAQKHKLVKVGDTIVFAGGVPLGIPGRTNLIRVCTVE